MKYSRKEIDKAGKIIISTSSDIFEKAEAIVKIDDWRKLHLPVIELLSNHVSSLLAEKGIAIAFSSQRLKRMTSIKEKLIRTTGMGLGGVQDIGGGRFVFEDMDSLLRAKDCITSAIFPDFTLDHDLYDYISKPKESGYRSIHFVYKYSKPESDLDGMRVELQIRTKLQHDWATAVETAELISNSSLKASQGDQAWLDFFKLVSAIFARRESQPVNDLFKDVTEEEYCTRYFKMNNKYKFVDNLNALVGAVSFTEQKSFIGGYVLLVINYDEKRVRIRHFTQDEKDSANEQYAQIEKSVDKTKEAIVLVAVSDVQELREAYPSYFLNSEEFIAALDDFQRACRIKGYIKQNAH
jgi:hypothetical protein